MRRPLSGIARTAILLVLILSSSTLAQTTQANAPPVPHGTAAQRLQSLLGLICFTLLAFAIGRLRGHRAAIPKRTLIWGMILQFAFGGIVVFNRYFLIVINATIDALLGFTAQGADLVFG